MTTATVTHSQSPVEIARHAFAELLNRRDTSLLMPFWAEDIVEYFPVGTFRGREELRAYFDSMFAALPDFHIEARKIVGDSETVFVRWHVSGTFSGAPWMGIEPTGARLELDGVDCFTFKNGVVVENVVTYDQLDFARQIGMLPEPGTTMDRLMLAGFNLKTRLAGRRGRRS